MKKKSEQILSELESEIASKGYETCQFVMKEYKPGPGWNRVSEQLAEFRSIPSRQL